MSSPINFDPRAAERRRQAAIRASMVAKQTPWERFLSWFFGDGK